MTSHDKSKSLSKPMLAMAVAFPLLMMSGCAGNATPSVSEAPKPTASETSAPAEEVVTVEAPTPEECFNEYTLQNLETLHIAPREMVTDDYGTYCAVTVSDYALENVKVSIDNKELVKDAVRDLGFTQKELDEAVAAALKFAAEETLDSVRLEAGPEGYEEWLTENNIVSKDSVQSYVDYHAESNSNTGLVIDGIFSPAHLIRDGKQRLVDVELTVNQVDAQEYNGVDYLAVSIGSSATHRFDNEQGKALIASYKPEIDASQFTEEIGIISVNSQTLQYKKGAVKDGIVGAFLEGSIFSPTAEVLYTSNSSKK